MGGLLGLFLTCLEVVLDSLGLRGLGRSWGALGGVSDSLGKVLGQEWCVWYYHKQLFCSCVSSVYVFSLVELYVNE